jgi:hypothetical protein
MLARSLVKAIAPVAAEMPLGTPTMPKAAF